MGLKGSIGAGEPGYATRICVKPWGWEQRGRRNHCGLSAKKLQIRLILWSVVASKFPWNVYMWDLVVEKDMR